MLPLDISLEDCEVLETDEDQPWVEGSGFRLRGLGTHCTSNPQAAAHCLGPGASTQALRFIGFIGGSGFKVFFCGGFE